MSSDPDEPLPGASEPGSDGRLDAWKKIAAYLRRSVRSARRWEKEEGLPVHRHAHRKGDSVYAFKTELDRWWSDRGASLGEATRKEEVSLPPVEPAASDVEPIPEEPVQAVARPRNTRVAAWIVAGCALAVLVGAISWPSLGRFGRATSVPSLAFQARDWVLVADFENRTGEKLFDGTLDYALARELSNSRYVSVVPRERVGDALRLMRKPLDSAIDPGIGREVCLRDGEIRALLTGRVERVGSKYVVSVEIVEPTQGTTLAGFTEEATGAETALATVRRISDRIRSALRENLSQETSDPQLVRVTTPNLRALQLYSQADELMASNGNHAAAEELLRRAVAEDSDFASAYIHLAFAIANQGRPLEEFRPFAETAFRLAETTTDRERYFIRGSYYELLGQPERAIAAYEALLILYPDHFWATNNLIFLYDGLWRDGEVARFAARRADLRPKDFLRNSGAALHLARVEPDLARTRIYVRRARELISEEVLRDSPDRAAWLELFPANERWFEGDAPAAFALATRFAEKVDSTPSLRRNRVYIALGNLFLTLGRLKTAAELFHLLENPNYQLTSLALLRGDRQELRRLSSALVVESYHVHLGIGTLLARTGRADQGERVLAEWERDTSEARPGMLEVVRGELAMARGQTAEAVRQLRKSQETTRFPGSFEFLLGMETLASHLARQGDVNGAIDVLESGSRQKRQVAFHLVSNGVIWQRNQLLLARLYRKAGRVADAQRVEADLLNQLAVADADHPILVELRRVRKL